jgi:hypothetical protein
MPMPVVAIGLSVSSFDSDDISDPNLKWTAPLSLPRLGINKSYSKGLELMLSISQKSEAATCGNSLHRSQALLKLLHSARSSSSSDGRFAFLGHLANR